MILNWNRTDNDSLDQVVNGMSDNLLTSVIRAWDTDATIDMKQKLILVAPAMNSVHFSPPAPCHPSHKH